MNRGSCVGGGGSILNRFDDAVQAYWHTSIAENIWMQGDSSRLA